MARTIDSILSGVRDRIISQISDLGSGSVYLSYEPSKQIPYGHRSVVIFAPQEIALSGFKGGLEWKRIRFEVRLVIRQTTDRITDDRTSVKRLLGAFQDDVVAALNGQFLSGDAAVDEPLEWVRQSVPKVDRDDDIGVAMVSLQFECSAVDLVYG